MKEKSGLLIETDVVTKAFLMEQNITQEPFVIFDINERQLFVEKNKLEKIKAWAMEF